MARLHALIALRHASAASLLGDMAAFQAAISQARHELDRGPRDSDPPEWLRFVDDTEITGIEARGWLNLGDAHRSAALYRQVLADVPGTRDRASYGAGLADALLKQGARQDAVAAAAEVLTALEAGVTSMRCLIRLRIIRQAARDTAGAQEFCERFDAIERTLTASSRPALRGHARSPADIPALPGEKSRAASAEKRALMKTPGLDAIRLRTGFPWPGTGSDGLNSAISAILDITDERSPPPRPDGQAVTVRVL